MTAKHTNKRKLYFITEKGIAATVEAFKQMGFDEDQALGRKPLFPETEREADPPMDNKQQAERWRCISGFNLGADRICRGDWLSDQQTAALEACRNSAQLKDSYLRRGVPPADWQPLRRAAPAPINATYTQSPAPGWVHELAQQAAASSFAVQLAEAVVRSGYPFNVAVDKVPSDLLRHGLKEYADLKKPTTGKGSYRASVEFFNEFMAAVIGRIKQAKQVAA